LLGGYLEEALNQLDYNCAETELAHL